MRIIGNLLWWLFGGLEAAFCYYPQVLRILLVVWCILFVKTKDWMKAYLCIRFEKEAYSHQNELDYLQHRKHYSYVSTAG